MCVGRGCRKAPPHPSYLLLSAVVYPSERGQMDLSRFTKGITVSIAILRHIWSRQT